MTIEDAVGTLLQPLVGNRVAWTVFPQPPSVPVWPAIRCTIVDTVAVVDICGDGDDDTATIRLQIDCVAKTFPAVRTLRLQVMEAMRGFEPPAIIDSSGSDYDEDTLTHRERIDYLIHGSSS